MATFSDQIISVVSKRPEQRTDFEITDIVPWFRTKSSLFKTVKPEIIRNVVRNCGYLYPSANEVIIKQGDSGDKLYIVVKGSLSIHVLQENVDIKNVVDAAIEKSQKQPPLDRDLLGNNVWTTGEGGAVGEVALIRDDCIRTASVVANTNTALIVVDRTLYNVSVRDVIEREYRTKTEFVESHWLFRQWSARHKRQMAISLHHETVSFGYPVVRQGQTVDHAYFILSGEVQLSVNPGYHRRQYGEIWKEMENKFPFLLPKERSRGECKAATPHEELKRRKLTNQRQQIICLLRGFEYIGFLEFLLRLDTYALSAHCTCEGQVLAINRDQFERFIERRYPETIAPFKYEIGLRLNFFLLRIKNASVLEYVLLKLQDSDLLRIYNTDSGKVWIGDCLREEIKKMRATRSKTGYGELMELLQTRYVTSSGVCEPDEQTTNDLLEKLEGRIHDWLNAVTPLHPIGQQMKSAQRVTALKRFQIQNARESPRGGNKILTQPNTSLND